MQFTTTITFVGPFIFSVTSTEMERDEKLDGIIAEVVLGEELLGEVACTY